MGQAKPSVGTTYEISTTWARGGRGRGRGLAGARGRAGARKSKKDAKKQRERKRSDESDSLVRDGGEMRLPFEVRPGSPF